MKSSPVDGEASRWRYRKQRKPYINTPSRRKPGPIHQQHDIEEWRDPFMRSSRMNPKGTAAKSSRAGRGLSPVKGGG
jgi:hypothetical protein